MSKPSFFCTPRCDLEELSPAALQVITHFSGRARYNGNRHCLELHQDLSFGQFFFGTRELSKRIARDPKTTNRAVLELSQRGLVKIIRRTNKGSIGEICDHWRIALNSHSLGTQEGTQAGSQAGTQMPRKRDPNVPSNQETSTTIMKGVEASLGVDLKKLRQSFDQEVLKTKKQPLGGWERVEEWVKENPKKANKWVDYDKAMRNWISRSLPDFQKGPATPQEPPKPATDSPPDPNAALKAVHKAYLKLCLAHKPLLPVEFVTQQWEELKMAYTGQRIGSPEGVARHWVQNGNFEAALVEYKESKPVYS